MNKKDLIPSLIQRCFELASETAGCKTQHIAMYMWIVQQNNWLGWKKEFVLPTADTMNVLKIGNRQTYMRALLDLEKWGLIRVVQHGKNQFRPFVIQICMSESEYALVGAMKKPDTSGAWAQECSVESEQALAEATRKGLTGSELALQRSNENEQAATEAAQIQGTDIGARALRDLNNINIYNKKYNPGELFPEDGKEKSKQKQKEVIEQFGVFYEHYGKKVDRYKALKIWTTLTDNERKLALADAPDYNRRHPDKQYQKSPAVYLRGKNWEDEKAGFGSGDPSRWPSGLKKIVV